MINSRVLFFSLLVICTLKLSAKAQSADTVDYCLRFTTLNDSTIFKYEIGSFKLIQSGGYRFLKFVDPDTISADDLFTTDSFIVSGANDSISFARFVSFDDQHYIRPVVIDTSDSHALDSIATLFSSRYSGLNIKPDTNSFASNSSMLFILELRSTSTNAVIARLDTLKCYVSSSGQLRYRNYPASFNKRTTLLPATIGTHAYLHVQVEYNLPLTSSIISQAYTFSTHNQPMETEYIFENQEGLPSGPLGMIEQLIVASPKESPLRISHVTPDPSNGIFAVTIQGPGLGNVTFTVVNEAGAVVARQQSYLVGSEGSVNLDLSSLANGIYTLVVHSGHNDAMHRVQIIK